MLFQEPALSLDRAATGHGCARNVSLKVRLLPLCKGTGHVIVPRQNLIVRRGSPQPRGSRSVVKVNWNTGCTLALSNTCQAVLLWATGEAVRQCGLSEGRVLNSVVRYCWKLPKRIEAPHPRELLSPVVGVVTPAESLQERLKHDAEATRVDFRPRSPCCDLVFSALQPKRNSEIHLSFEGVNADTKHA